MSETTPTVEERLRSAGLYVPHDEETPDGPEANMRRLCNDAAEEIARLRQEIAQAREALVDAWHVRVVEALALVGDAVRAETEDERRGVLFRMDRLRYDTHVQAAVDRRALSSTSRGPDAPVD